MNRAALALATLTVASLGACAPARTDPRALFLTPWQPPPGQRCSVSKKRIPDASLVFDTAVLAQDLAGLGPGTAVVALAFWPADTAWHEEYGERPDSMTVVEATVPDTMRALIRAALLDAVRGRTAARLLIRLDLNGHPQVRLAPALECPPAVRSAADLRRYTGALQSVGAPPGRAVLQFLVRADGVLTGFEIRTSSGDPDFDRAALSVIPLLRFTPGLINHVRVPGLVRFPVDVRVTRRGPPPPPTAAACPRGRVVEVTNPLPAAVHAYAFAPAGAQLLGTVGAAATVRFALPPESAGYGFVQWADAPPPEAREGDLYKVRWSVKCGVR